MSQNIIDQIGVTVVMISVNGKKSSDFAELSPIKLLLQRKVFDHIHFSGKDADIKPIVHAKLVEELRQYVSPALIHLPNFWDDASDRVKESVTRKHLASRFFHTVEFEFAISSMESIDSFDLLQAHVRANDKYEDTLLAHMVKILKMHRKNIHKAIENSIENHERTVALKLGEPEEPTDRCLRIVTVKNPKLPCPITLELKSSVQKDNSSVTIAELTKQLLQEYMRDYQSIKTANWMRSVASGSTSYEMRLTYLQQIKDVTTMVDIFCSDETWIESVYEFAIPLFNREISNQEYNLFFSTLNTTIHRKNYFALDKIFGNYQVSIGTQHKDGVAS